jgi:polar amino acid transport system substrate-binding protein
MNLVSVLRKHRYLPSIWLYLIVLFAFSACSSKDGSNDSSHGTTLQKAIASKTVRIGFANEAPFAYEDVATGKVTGEAPEVAREVLSHMGIYQVEGVLTEFGALIPGLRAGRFDIIASGMYILPQRCEQIAFSNPTYSVGEAFAVKAGNPLSLHSYQDAANNKDAKVGVVSGAIESNYASAMGIAQDRVIVFPNPVSALEGLMAGRIDALAGTRLTVANLLQKTQEGVENAAPFEDPEIDGHKVRGYGAFGFRKEDKDFVAAFNAELKNYIGTRRHLNLVRRFGFDEYDMPGNATADELCQPKQAASK